MPLSEARKLALLKLTVLDNPYIKTRPTERQAAFLMSEEEEVFFGGQAGGGKMLCLDVKVLTPFGWKANGDLQAGDVVIDPRTGGSATVIIAHPPQRQRVWRVTFEDGAFLDCCKDHLWCFRESGRRRKSQERIRASGLNDDWLNGYMIGTTAHLQKIVARSFDQQQRGIRPQWINIPVNRPVELTISHRYPDAHYPVDPYVLGVLIGDGCLGKNVTITGKDAEIDGWIEAAYPGEMIRYDSRSIGIRNGRLIPGINASGLRGKKSWEKFIPKDYLLLPLSIRVPLMQGLIDTDGYIDDRGHISYTTTSEQLASDVQCLARSLGALAKITTKPAGYKDTSGNYVPCRLAYNVWITPHDPDLFARLSRKTARAIKRQNPPMRRITYVEALDDFADMRCITLNTRDGLYIADDFVVTHNSEALLAAALQYVKYPGYSALLLRRTYADLALPEAIMDRSHQWLQNTDARWSNVDKRWTFPSGAKLTFGYLQTENDKYRYQGAEFQFCGFDELTQFENSQYQYMRSRLRRKIGLRVPVRMRAASNPGGVGHVWVRDHWNMPHGLDSRPFIPSRIADNPHIDQEAYEQALDGLPGILRAQLKLGDWTAVDSGELFSRQWFTVVRTCPAQMDYYCRYWDLAATKKKKNSDDPDYTAGALLGVKDGLWYIIDIKRARETPKQVEALVRQTGAVDGYEIPVGMEEEGGASGKNSSDHYRREVMVGFDFRTERATGSKAVRAGPLSAAAEAGNVALVKGAWNETFLDEAELFTGSGKDAHDDQVDACSGAFNMISSRYIVPSVGHLGPDATGFDSTYFRKSADQLSDELMEAYKGMTPAERVVADQMLHS